MKKIISCLCIMTLMLSLFGCSSDNQNFLTEHVQFESYELILKDATI